MAKKSLVVKQQKEPKFKVRKYNRCKICGRVRGYIRDYGVCRMCFRELAHRGLLPGIRKASW
ncbi:MAG: type Z 30S ribosomal protein S14 [Spirochaetia bacterium]|nr:type Z 30S ribosomal protein S14 [Spirochaetota bacterium]MCX8096135.1 type Z 30S ribosomal protein S14 [Spirochaetota bacterium]MDW8112382.1 type Z 30S ribosomal protein S14 [Spirochaetia bacterium]